MALGLGSRSGSAAIPAFLAAHAGDALWTIAVYLTLALARPTIRPALLFVAAVSISFAVEFSQRFDPPWLVELRRQPLARLLLGQGWVTLDLARYAAGGLCAWALDRLVLWRPRLSRAPEGRESRRP